MKRDALIAVRIPQSRKQILEEWAKEDGCTLSDLINNLIENRLQREKRHARQAKNKKVGE